MIRGRFRYGLLLVRNLFVELNNGSMKSWKYSTSRHEGSPRIGRIGEGRLSKSSKYM